MSLLFFEGFEGMGSASGGTLTNLMLERVSAYLGTTGTSVLVDNDLTDGKAWRNGSASTSYNNYVRHHFSSDQSSYTLTCGMRYLVCDTSSAWLFRYTDASDVTQCQLRLNNVTDLQFQRGTTTIASVNSVLTADTWHYIEMEVVFSDTVGTVKVWVDDTEEINSTGLDTLVNGNGIHRIRFGGQGIPDAPSSYSALDDIYVINDQGSDFTERLGKDTRVYISYPTADDGTNEWTPSTGTDHYALVDEDPQSETDYLDGDATGEEELFTMENYTGTDREVIACMPEAVCQLTSAGSEDIKMRYEAVSGGALTVDVTATNVAAREIRTTDDASDPLDKDKFNAMAIGFEYQ
jgi:hypothetical protein